MLLISLLISSSSYYFIEKYINNEIVSFNKDLDLFLNKYKSNTKIYKVMCYSLKNGGKRLRPIIIKEVAKSLIKDKQSLFLRLLFIFINIIFKFKSIRVS